MLSRWRIPNVPVDLGVKGELSVNVEPQYTNSCTASSSWSAVLTDGAAGRPHPSSASFELCNSHCVQLWSGNQQTSTHVKFHCGVCGSGVFDFINIRSYSCCLFHRAPSRCFAFLLSAEQRPERLPVAGPHCVVHKDVGGRINVHTHLQNPNSA